MEGFNSWRIFALPLLGQRLTRNMDDLYYRNGTVHWVKTMDLTNAYINKTEEMVTTYALNETSLRIYPAGTVLVAMYGGFNQIGRTGLLKIPAAVNQAITAIQPKADELVSEYLIKTLNLRVDYWKSVASSSRKDTEHHRVRTSALPYCLPPPKPNKPPLPPP